MIPLDLFLVSKLFCEFVHHHVIHHPDVNLKNWELVLGVTGRSLALALQAQNTFSGNIPLRNDLWTLTNGKLQGKA